MGKQETTARRQVVVDKKLGLKKSTKNQSPHPTTMLSRYLRSKSGSRSSEMVIYSLWMFFAPNDNP
jgi:hypothetical protein